MICPKCGSNTQIVDSRMNPDGTQRRRRACESLRCRYRFTTYEIEFEKIKNDLNTLKRIKELLTHE